MNPSIATPSPRPPVWPELKGLRLSRGARRTYDAMLVFRDESLTQEELAAYLYISVRSLQRHIRELVERGLIKKMPTAAYGSGQPQVSYRFLARRRD